MGISAGGDAFGGGAEGFDQGRFHRREVAHELIGFLFADELVHVGEPLRRGRVQGRVGHDQFAAVLRLDQIFQSFGRVGGIDDALVVDDADDVVARARPQVRVDGVFRKVSDSSANRIRERCLP